MIKFFRRIRQKSLFDTKFSKYLLYAIGEIILVVIGILIALQFSNWNENIKNISKEKHYLENFKKDLVSNKAEINFNIERGVIIYNRLDTLVQLKKNESEKINLKNMSVNLLYATAFNVYNSKEGTINDVIGSGNLNIIQNDSIRLAISSWENDLRGIRGQEAIDNRTGKTYADYLKENVSVYKVLNDDLTITHEEKIKLLNDIEFLNCVSERRYQKEVLIDLYRKELKRLEKLIALIDLELISEY